MYPLEICSACIEYLNLYFFLLFSVMGFVYPDLYFVVLFPVIVLVHQDFDFFVLFLLVFYMGGGAWL